MFAFSQLSRRQFFTVAGAMAAGIAAAACDVDSAALGQPDLVAVLGPDVVRRLGAGYRERVPGERDAPRLEAALRASRPWTARIGLGSVSIADQVRADFDANRTVVVDGWLLSVTEARQCALYSTLA